MPRAFRFKLQPVLNLRKQVEDEKARDLAAARRAVAAQKELMRRLRAEEIGCKADIARLERGRVDVQDVLAHRRFLNVLLKRQTLGGQDLQRLIGAENSAREALVEATKARKVMERLREKRFA
ncbi:MAG: hypothetical protein RDV41_06255, partial [Planctomycetota bacterium]|nr:hypothetical protein [Planctomycetota bacterium]